MQRLRFRAAVNVMAYQGMRSVGVFRDNKTITKATLLPTISYVVQHEEEDLLKVFFSRKTKGQRLYSLYWYAPHILVIPNAIVAQ